MVGNVRKVQICGSWFLVDYTKLEIKTDEFHVTNERLMKFAQYKMERDFFVFIAEICMNYLDGTGNDTPFNEIINKAIDNGMLIGVEPTLPDITLKMSFEDMLGKSRYSIPEQVRRERWEEWKALAANNGEHNIIDNWKPHEDCHKCVHMNNDWCNTMGLPCAVNPVISFSDGVPGFACMGYGLVTKEEVGG